METNKDIGVSVEYYKAQLELCQKKLLRVERQLEKSESYNEDLRSQLEKVSAELHQYRTASKQRVDAAVQTEEIIADSDGITVQLNTEADVSQGESKDTVLREKVQETSTGEQIYSNNSSENQLPHEEGQSASNNVTGEEVTTPSTSLAEELKSAAEEAISQSGYVYDERSGLYYDYNSGYYYDAEKSLFYDPNSGTYFYFNNETQEYTFHSQVDVSQYTTPYYGYYKNTSYRDHDQPSSNWSTQSSSYSQGQGYYSSQYYSDRRDRRRDVKTSSRRKTVEDKENRYHRHSEKYSSKRSGSRDKTRSEGVTEKHGNKKKCKSEKKKKKKKEKDSESEDKKSKKKKKKEKKERKKKRKEKKQGKDNDKVEEEDMDTREQVCVIDSTGQLDNEVTEDKSKVGNSVKTESSDSDLITTENTIEKTKESVQKEIENSNQKILEEKSLLDVTVKKDISMDVEECELKNSNNNAECSNVDSDSESILGNNSQKCDDVIVTEKCNTGKNSQLTGETAFTEATEQGKKCSEKLLVKDEQCADDKDEIYNKLSSAIALTSDETQLAQKALDSIDESSLSQDSIPPQESKDSTDDSSMSSRSSSPSPSTSSRSLCTGESELESGELSESECDSESVVMVSDEDDNDCVITGSENTENMDGTGQTQGYHDGIQQGEEIGSGSWPPCIRVIVTDSDCLDPGSLYIVTCDGAQIGREKDQGNTIIIPDLNVSKVHASISYQSDLQQYVITDHGSQNGTFLDETRISESKIESRAEKLSHGSTLQFSCTRFLLHIHNGTETCDECEPGQVQATMSKPAQKEAYTFLSKEEKIKQQRLNLKQIKKKYGLQNAPYVDNVEAIKNPTYQDKAEERRRTKGSDNPYIPDEAPASVNKPIAETNVGHKLLKKMGWSEGESLGKDNEGIQQPIMASIRANQKAGLGSSLGGEQSLDNANITSKYQRKLQAQARFQKVSKESDNNQGDSGSSSNWVQGETQTS